MRGEGEGERKGGTGRKGKEREREGGIKDVDMKRTYGWNMENRERGMERYKK